MRRSLWLVMALALLLPGAASQAFAGAVFLGPGPDLTGNDTGASLPTDPIWRGVSTARWLPIGARVGGGCRT